MRHKAHPRNTGIPFRFKKGDSIGELDAESDKSLLSECFVDTGDYITLVDLERSQCIAVGGTGSGKSALLKMVSQREERVIEIKPENLSLQYICNSDIIATLEAEGAKLDIFYNLLWRHVLATELLKFHYKLHTQEKTDNWLGNLLYSLKSKDQTKERALKYIKEWGDRFWHETEYRVKEITQKLESDIEAEVGTKITAASLKTSGRKREEVEQITEVINKAQSVINNIQMKSLSDVIRFLDEDVFNDSKVKTYIVIDELDVEWAPDHTRYKLIRALIETIKSFRTISTVKILIAMRRDLLETVFSRTIDAGFQEEKYESLLLRIRWTKSQIQELVDKRIHRLVKARYTGKSLGLKDIFPKQIERIDFFDYLVERTLYRPRDAIAFVNECLSRSDGKEVITTTIVKQAELEYSAKRVRALHFEWTAHYPKLDQYFELIEGLPVNFKISAFPKDRLEPSAIKFLEDTTKTDPMNEASTKYINTGNSHVFLATLVRYLYHVGAIGIKTDGFSPVRWSYDETVSPSEGQIKPNSTVHIHPMLWGRLGTMARN